MISSYYLRTLWSCITVTVLLLINPVTIHAEAESVSPRDLAASARDAMEAEEFGRALEIYQQLHELMPNVAEIPFNEAVAQYRLGLYDEATKLFSDAMNLTSDQDLQLKSTYNLGNSTYQQSLQALEGDQQNNPATMDNLKVATQGLEEAIAHYRQALQTDPGDEDARVNAELTHQLLKQLQQIQEQMQQQQQQSQDSQDDSQQSENNQSEQNSSKSDSESDNQEQDKQSQQSQSESGQQSEQQDPQESSSSSTEDTEEQQEETQASSAQSTEEDHSAEEQESATEQQVTPMNQAEAERLLQRVRDRAKQRREQLAEQQKQKYKPAEKDW